MLLSRIVTLVEDEAIDENGSMYDGQDQQKYLKAGKGQEYDN